MSLLIDLLEKSKEILSPKLLDDVKVIKLREGKNIIFSLGGDNKEVVKVEKTNVNFTWKPKYVKGLDLTTMMNELNIDLDVRLVNKRSKNVLREIKSDCRKDSKAKRCWVYKRSSISHMNSNI